MASEAGGPEVLRVPEERGVTFVVSSQNHFTDKISHEPGFEV